MQTYLWDCREKLHNNHVEGGHQLISSRRTKQAQISYKLFSSTLNQSQNSQNKNQQPTKECAVYITFQSVTHKRPPSSGIMAVTSCHYSTLTSSPHDSGCVDKFVIICHNISGQKNITQSFFASRVCVTFSRSNGNTLSWSQQALLLEQTSGNVTVRWSERFCRFLSNPLLKNHMLLKKQ